MEKQTAVEWLEEHIIIGLTYDQQLLFEATFEQAKEMEREQIMDAYSNGRVDEQFKGTTSSFYITKPEQYYNQTFKPE